MQTDYEFVWEFILDHFSQGQVFTVDRVVEVLSSAYQSKLIDTDEIEGFHETASFGQSRVRLVMKAMTIQRVLVRLPDQRYQVRSANDD